MAPRGILLLFQNIEDHHLDTEVETASIIQFESKQSYLVQKEVYFPLLPLH